MSAQGGAYKKGLNREILNAAPGMFHQMLKYKAEEAGVEWISRSYKIFFKSLSNRNYGFI